MIYFMRFISQLFHPLLMITYVLLLLYIYLPEAFSPVAAESIPSLLLATFLTTVVIPALSISLLRMTSKITSMELTNREERILPFLSIAIFYGSATFLFITKLSINPPVSIMLIGVSVLLVILFLITLGKFKISIHSAAIWGVCGFLCALSISITGTQLMIPLLIAFIAAGLVSTSRLFLNYHTSTEIWSGALLGFVYCFLVMYYFG